MTTNDDLARNLIRSMREIRHGRKGRSQVDATGGSSAMTHTQPFHNPMTGLGDIIYGGFFGQLLRRQIGTAGEVLCVEGGVPVWGDCLGDCIETLSASNYVNWQQGPEPTVDVAPGSLHAYGPAGYGGAYYNAINVDPTQSFTIIGSIQLSAARAGFYFGISNDEGSWDSLDVGLLYSEPSGGGGSPSMWLESPNGSDWIDFTSPLTRANEIVCTVDWNVATDDVTVSMFDGTTTHTIVIDQAGGIAGFMGPGTNFYVMTTGDGDDIDHTWSSIQFCPGGA